MRYNIIASGSKGNCTILEDILAIDMGVTYQQVSPYLSTVKMILLTHIHRDHFLPTTIKKIASKHPDIYFVCGKHLEEESRKHIPNNRLFVVEECKELSFGVAIISCFPLVHDVHNVGWKVFMKGEKCIYATDTCTLEGIVAKNYNLYLIEANYEEKELQNRIREKRKKGEYIYEHRVERSHLSKEKCDEWLLQNMGEESVNVYMHKHEI